MGISSSKILIIAGERSGDLHGSEIVKILKGKTPGIEFFGIGGEKMRRHGVETLYDLSDIAVVGFFEVFKNFRRFRTAFHSLLKIAAERHPDVAILIDLPGFNLRFGPKLKELGIPVIYYISPQVWAWGRNRLQKMRLFVDKMLVIFPFEVDLYKQVGIDVHFVGHPLIDRLKVNLTAKQFRERFDIKNSEKIISILPGSREHEINRNLPAMIQSARLIRKKFPGARFFLPAASEKLKNVAQKLIDKSNLRIDTLQHSVYDAMNASDAAIVSSGTATLETGYFGTPLVILYKMSPLSYLIAKRLVTIPNVGLINIVAEKKIVPEYIQRNAKPEKIASKIIEFLTDKELSDATRSELLEARNKLGPPGASARAADAIVKFLDTKTD